MGDLVPQVLILTSWISNCLTKRKEKRMQREYKDADNLLFFRPVDELDLPRITALEVLPVSAIPSNSSRMKFECLGYTYISARNPQCFDDQS